MTYGGNGCFEITQPSRGMIITGRNNSPDPKESIANAHLIAAAPDLLEALENMVCLARLQSWDRAITGRQILLEAAQIAIAKATGEQS